jgi:SPP1 family predicted phage head-tail adaptor
MRAPDPGELKERISILNVTPPYNGHREGTIVSTFLSNIWAKIDPLAGGLVEETQQEQLATQSYNIWIRYAAGVTAFQEIDWGGVRLVMTAPPEEIVRRQWLLIHAEGRQSRKF